MYYFVYISSTSVHLVSILILQTYTAVPGGPIPGTWYCIEKPRRDTKGWEDATADAKKNHKQPPPASNTYKMRNEERMLARQGRAQFRHELRILRPHA